MIMKRLFRTMLLMAVLCTASVGAWGYGMHVSATQDSSLEEEDEDEEEEYEDDDTDELEQQRQDTMDRIDSIKSDINTVEERIKDLKSTKSNLQTYISQLDRQVNTLAAQISELEDQIDVKNAEIQVKTEELEAAEAEGEEQYEMMKKRIRYMYEQGDQSFLVLLLESESVADLMNRAEYAVQMSAYDRKMMEEMKAFREEIDRQRTELEAEKAEKEDLLSEVESQKSAVNKAISAKTQEIASYQSQINTASGEQSEYEKQLAEQEKLLEQVENQIAAAAAAKADQNDGDGGASGFAWPCPASRRITSYFGPRKAPVAGASTYHKGIDIGAGTGASIVATASGRVTTAAYSSSAGNYVIVSHGNGISSVYMHASALYVSEGDIVSRGQTIAAVGSTGYSTGPHLHFGIVVNGSYVNPLNYVN
ncbi:MAG: peptidoglycan DD-metalloendopeptidase family protein [Clostridiales bacterium]|nr:peptidoglycan DD-metalloendopeptidase family protein [Clostridiales bacterium]